jgi:hypothetical protein
MQLLAIALVDQVAKLMYATSQTATRLVPMVPHGRKLVRVRTQVPVSWMPGLWRRHMAGRMIRTWLQRWSAWRGDPQLADHVVSVGVQGFGLADARMLSPVRAGVEVTGRLGRDGGTQQARRCTAGGTAGPHGGSRDASQPAGQPTGQVAVSSVGAPACAAVAGRQVFRPQCSHLVPSVKPFVLVSV